MYGKCLYIFLITFDKDYEATTKGGGVSYAFYNAGSSLKVKIAFNGTVISTIRK